MLALILCGKQEVIAFYTQWALTCPASVDLYPHDNTTDATGNVYNTGRYVGTVDLDPSPGVLSFTASGFTDAFIQKLDPLGNVIWVANFTGGSWELISGLVVDPSGNLYAIGYFAGTVDFDPGPGVFSLSSVGGNDVVILKLSPAGSLIWAKSFGGIGNDEGLYIGCDLAGNVYLGGTYSGSIDFNPDVGVFNRSSAGGLDPYIVKLDAAGNFSWACDVGTPNSDYLYGMDVSATGDVVIVGSFSGSGDFNPNAGVYTLTAVAFTDIFIVKVNTSGIHQWTSTLGSAGFDGVNDVCFTTGGDVLLCGGFNTAIDFDPGPGVVLLSPSSLDGYLLRLNGSGGFLWVKQFNGFSLIPLKVEVNSSDDIFLIGSFKGTVDFDPGPSTVSVTSGNISQDSFVLGLNNTGDYEWHLDPEGNINFDQLMTFTVSSAGHLFFMGRFTQGTIDLIPGPGVMSVTNPTASAGNGFFFKLNAGSPLPVIASPLTGENVNGFANLTWSTFTEENNEGFIIQRKENNEPWKDIGFVEGHGNSHALIQYSYSDERRLTGTTYYRYVQRDFNGRLTPSSVIVLVASDNTADHSGVYPNPGNGELNFDALPETDGERVLRVTNSIGELLILRKISAVANDSPVYIPGPPGMYLVTIETRKSVNHIRYLKQ